MLTEQIAHDRTTMSLPQKLTYQFPPRLANTEEIPKNIMEYIKNNEIMLVARYENDENEDNLVTFKVPCNLKPVEVVETIFKKHSFKHKKEDTPYILKVYGQDEYIYGDYPIIQFLYVQVSYFVFQDTHFCCCCCWDFWFFSKFFLLFLIQFSLKFMRLVIGEIFKISK